MNLPAGSAADDHTPVGVELMGLPYSEAKLIRSTLLLFFLLTPNFRL